MSTIRVDNFAPSAGGTEFGIYGVAKSAAQYNQSSPSVVGSENVSSITDDSVGTFTVNYSNNHSDATYTLSGIAEGSNQAVKISDDSSILSASCQFVGETPDGTNSDQYNSVITFGDLA